MIKHLRKLTGKSWLFVIALMMMSSKCRQYNELGPDSVFFKFNGTPLVANEVLIIPGDPEVIGIRSGDSLYLYYYIHRYHGRGLYVLHPDDTTMQANAHIWQKHNNLEYYPGIPEGNTYIRVFEHDTTSGFFHAVFEARLKDSLDHKAYFTEGRIFINVPDDY